MIVPKQKKILAAVLVHPGQFELQELEVPEPAADEVRVNLEYCGESALPIWLPGKELHGLSTRFRRARLATNLWVSLSQ
jgi:hypothetical protein